MNKINKHLPFSLTLFLLLFYPLLFAEETVTITTYYPSPYGVYSSLQVDKLGVGDNSGDNILNSADVPTTSGDAWIKGKVGIGTAAPGGFFGNANALHVYNSAGSGELRIQGGSGNGILELDASTGADWHVQNSGGTFTITETSSAPDRLTILSGGSVGIGTAAPNIGGMTRALTVSGGTSGEVDTALELQGRRNTIGAPPARISFYNATNVVSVIEAIRGSADDEGYLAFLTRKTGLPIPAENMRIDADGRVGIGTQYPGERLSVGSNTFQVNYSGNLVKVNNVAYSWPSSQGGASTALTNDGSGNLSWGAGASGITATLTFTVPCNQTGTTSIDVSNGIITGYTTGYGDCGDSGDDSGGT